jgi:1-acyl-sn-glycerol-3-phosphate acyltransferase
MKLLVFVRSALFWLLLSVSVIIAAVFLFVMIPFSTPMWRYRLCKGWCRFITELLRAVCGVQFEFVGLDRIPKEGPVILLSKHQSAWETLALTAFIPRRMSFVYKRELHRLPLFGQGLASLGMLSINRAKGRAAYEQMKKKVPAYFEKNWILALFPEGTRTPPGADPHYKTGGARIACDTGVPIIPVALNSGECWPRNSFCKYPGKITVVFGPEINPAGRQPQEVNQEVRDWIEGEMRVISPRYYPAKNS